MTKALLKNTLREIRDTKARFISILMIITLGVGFFIGVKATSPSMTQMAEDYYSETNLMDFRLVSTVGFDEYDVNAVKRTAGVASVMPSHYADVMVNSNGVASILRLMAAPYKYKTNEILNSPVVIEGHMPTKKGEIAVENGAFSTYKLGDTLTVNPKVGDTDVTDTLNTLDYTVVGIVQSPMYISFERGATTVGNGKVSGYAFVADEAFCVERYTEMYVTVRCNSDDSSPFGEAYESTIKEINSRLEKTADERVSVFIRDTVDAAQSEIDTNREKYNDEKTKAEKELSDAKAQLDKSEKEYNDKISTAQSQLDSAQSQIDQGKAQINTQKANYQKAVKEFNTQISAAKAELNASNQEYQKQYDEFYNVTKPQLEDTAAQIDSGITQTAVGTINGIASALPPYISPEITNQLNALAESITIDNARDSLVQLKSTLSAYGMDMLTPTIDSAISSIDELIAQRDIIYAGISEGEAKLNEGKAALESAESELTKKEKETSSQLAAMKSQLDAAESKLNSTQSTVTQSKSELEQAKATGKQMIDKGKKEYNSSKAEAEEKLSNAEKKLNDAQAELDKVDKDPKWYIFDRDDNPGYSTFIQNTNRVDAVAAVFPVFFLLVAMLVCLTTMTRLVEEKRTQIGTLKALGYSDKNIIAKFVIYSSTAAFIGCVIGCSVGIPILPRVIYNAYKMMYNMKDIKVVIPWGSFVIAIIAAFLCCGFVSFVVCYKALGHDTASLMRPKAPKPGKRILLERIGVLWKRLSFTSKVTGRNLFRYKSRLLMTVLGIAGCTALILSAFGLYDSISDVVDIQYDEVCHYNTIIVTNGDGDQNTFSSLMSDIENDPRISDNMLVMQKMSTIRSDSKTVSEEVYLTVPQKSDELDSLITLRNRTSKKSIKLADNSVVLTEKLADMLSVSKGDTVYLSDEKKEVTVADICENYVYNYIYATDNTYEKLFSQKPSFNMVLLKADNITDELEKSLGTDYLEKKDVSAISFMSTGIQNFNDMINSMNLVIIVMIVCAGALAIVVLYNLTNINLAERQREIATIKVLGFNHRETAAFIYRENIIMTILGVAVGLAAGIALAKYMIVTIEVDSVMFGRTIHPLSFVYAAAGTAFFSLVVNFIMYFKMKTIDMVESLKSIE